MQILRTLEAARRWRGGLAGRLALVPTMGALHDGHIAHVPAARSAAEHVALSIFVNPAQFGPNEDLARYPRPLEADLARCRAAGVDAVFLPEPAGMYPAGLPAAAVDVPSMTADLEGAQRPGHFGGVCRVVMKLLNILQPDAVTFGQKDYQQLVVCRAMIDDLNLPVRLVTVPTVREPDGLALSSRNIYLDADQRRAAVALFESLQLARSMVLEDRRTDPAVIEAAMSRVLVDRGVQPDYAAVRDRRTLAVLARVETPVVALVAGRLGTTRLLDNLLIGDQPGSVPA